MGDLSNGILWDGGERSTHFSTGKAYWLGSPDRLGRRNKFRKHFRCDVNATTKYTTPRTVVDDLDICG